MGIGLPMIAAAALLAAGLALAAASAPDPASAAPAPSAAPPAPAPAGDLQFVNTAFENASPLDWEVAPEGTVNLYLLYDHERDSPNRAAGHWHFQLQARPGADLAVVLHNFDNVWNRRHSVPVSKATVTHISTDGRTWRILPAEFIEGNCIRFCVHMDGPTLTVARLPPYRLSDLDRLLGAVRGHPLAEVTTIGRTVEGRPLEIIRIGRPDAPRRVLLRARAHAWEPGGNWVVEGLARALLRDEPDNRRCLQRYAVYVMPMANKDGVARGMTRFNVLGKDLNRNWDRPADAQLAPENAALEAWIERMIADGRRPDLVIDLHNDEAGKLNVSRPAADTAGYLQRMERLEALLRRHTWFTEGSTGKEFRNPGSIGEGLLERYGITACVLELNCNWIAGLKKPPEAADWQQFGDRLREVFFDYFDQ
jgi:hypothetical protein